MRKKPLLMKLLSDEVDDPVAAAERHGRLGAVAGQRVEALAASAGQDHHQYVDHRRGFADKRDAAVVPRRVRLLPHAFRSLTARFQADRAAGRAERTACAVSAA